MTKQEKIYALETVIRKEIPRLMELSYGCLMKFWDNTIYTTVLNTPREIAFIDRNRDHCTFQVIEPHQTNVIEVIGHDISLSDVLEWLNTEKIINSLCERISHTGHNAFVSLIQDGYLDISYYSHEYEISLSSRLGKWDLSKQSLKDQSEELINSLHRFLTN